MYVCMYSSVDACRCGDLGLCMYVCMYVCNVMCIVKVECMYVCMYVTLMMYVRIC